VSGHTLKIPPLLRLRHNDLNTPAASAPIATKRAAPRKTARPPEAKTQAAPEKAQIRTMLVPSCGWPTDAALPDRKRTTKR